MYYRTYAAITQACNGGGWGGGGGREGKRQLLGFGSREGHLQTVHRLGPESCVVKEVSLPGLLMILPHKKIVTN